jgi:protein-tyrosine phosphatase
MTVSHARDLAGVHNFRMLASYPLADGRRFGEGLVYRSGALELMTPEDLGHLRDELRIAAILDLRHPDELGGQGIGHGLADRVNFLSVFPERLTQEALIAELNGLYGAGPSPERYFHYLHVEGQRFADAFRFFADEANYPALVHCTAGKDRTGVILGMVMDVVGAADADIATEYGLSDQSIDRLIAYLRAMGRQLEGTEAEIRARMATPPERMAGFMTLLRERYGSAEGYLATQGVTAAEFAAVRRLLVR